MTSLSMQPVSISGLDRGCTPRQHLPMQRSASQVQTRKLAPRLPHVSGQVPIVARTKLCNGDP